MSFFTKGLDGEAASLTPISEERVAQLLTRMEIKHEVDDDGDLVAAWENGMLIFKVIGEHEEILSIRGFWRGLPGGDEALATAFEFTNEWNLEGLWPKVMLARLDDGRIRLCNENNFDWEHGATDEQLMQQLQCAIATGVSFWEECDKKFPEIAREFREEK